MISGPNQLTGRSILVLLLSLLIAGCGGPAEPVSRSGGEPYLEAWESLARHNEEPDWFKDSKFGIYFHWGVYCVPAYGNEWYPRNMHFQEFEEYRHHLEHFGHPSEFGYHDFVPMFRAEHFNPDQWAELFLKAGAKFAGPVAEHHDGFAMWDSDVTPWNSMDKGPGRDITGELEKAITSRGMRFIATFHHARNLQRYKGLEEEVIAKEKNIHFQFRKSHYPLFPGMPPSMDHPERNYLYGNIPEEEWVETIWFGKLAEVVDRYRPDIIYFDSWLNYIPESMRLRFCAYYLNRAREWDKEVVIVRKQDDLPLECSVEDLEKSRKPYIGKKAWMTDETISDGSWCYTDDLHIKSSAEHLHILIDIVSKNGVLLLNISPRADGIIPADQQQVLLEMGAWLNRFGEAIYGTRPWHTFGEGPTRDPEGDYLSSAYQKIRYTPKDIRYTTAGNTVYAIFLGKLSGGEKVVMKSFAAGQAGRASDVRRVSIPGIRGQLDWSFTEDGLVVRLPGTGLDERANVLKIETEDSAIYP